MSYSLYYMLTSRCNLNCKYCFRDASKESIEGELSLGEIKTAIDVLYNKFNVRKITLSGGEPTFLKNNDCSAFVELIEHIKKYKTDDPMTNLRVVLITNAILLNEDIARCMIGVVDRVTITIDAKDNKILEKLGRNNQFNTLYFENSISKIKMLSKLGFEIKLHSVVSPINYTDLIELAKYLKMDKELNIVKWKFFQYMTFGNPNIDKIFDISVEKYYALENIIAEELRDTGIRIGFKSVLKQEESLFDLLPNGKFEYITTKDGKIQRGLTEKIFEYNGWDDLFNRHPINKEIFYKLHKM